MGCWPPRAPTNLQLFPQRQGKYDDNKTSMNAHFNGYCCYYVNEDYISIFVGRTYSNNNKNKKNYNGNSNNNNNYNNNKNNN